MTGKRAIAILLLVVLFLSVAAPFSVVELFLSTIISLVVFWILASELESQLSDRRHLDPHSSLDE